jgi:hypothetical protein
VYPGKRRGNNSRPHAQIAAASPSMGMAREVRHSLPGRAATSLPWCHSPLHVLDLSLA